MWWPACPGTPIVSGPSMCPSLTRSGASASGRNTCSHEVWWWHVKAVCRWCWRRVSVSVPVASGRV
eukprot:scaffold133204_cov90-Phaeocystis_antarctica.AAC.2